MQKSKIRLLLVDDHPIVREGIRGVLAATDNIEIVGEAEDGNEAVRLVADLQPDIVLMDISMPVANGLETTLHLCREFPQVKLIALSMHDDEEYILKMVRLGARGYVSKHRPPSELVAAVEAVARGEVFFSPRASQVLLKDYVEHSRSQGMPREPELSKREREVLLLLVGDVSARDIARQLNISLRTVEAHRSHIMSKLQINTLAGLTKYALAKGLIHL